MMAAVVPDKVEQPRFGYPECQEVPELTQDVSSVKVGNPAVWWKLVVGKADKITVCSMCAIFNDLCKKYVFQLEKSADGFIHYQCLLQLNKKQRRPSILLHLATMFELPMQNFQIAPSDSKFVPYCTKKETRLDGPWSKGIMGVQIRPPKLLLEADMYDWQKSLLEEIQEKPDDTLK